ncbi:choice-of-anchor A family protein [Microbacterium sp. CJ88]|uniref:choice-of-anchor A family protein n=1 Tax=Microbacterium sp. CJ88 TaxID=3445672 RepID=UPI003F65878B
MVARFRRRVGAVVVAAALVAAGAVVAPWIMPGGAASAATGVCPPGTVPGPGGPGDNEQWTDANVAVHASGSLLVDGGAAELEGLVVVEGDAVFSKAAPGRVNVGWVGVGSQIAPPPGSTMLAVGGALSVSATTTLDVGANAREPGGPLLGGDVTVGGAAAPAFPSARYELNNGALTEGMGSDATAPWASFGALVAASSADFASRPVTGTTVVAGPRATFTGSGAPGDVQVFTLTGVDASAVSEIAFVGIPATSPVIITVTGASPVTMTHTYYSDDGVRADVLTSPLFGEVASRTLWNYPDATAVSVGGSSQILGSIVAPAASLDITASTNGRVYGRDIHMHGVGNELHNYPWIAPPFQCVPEVPEITGSVTITKTLASSGVVAADREFGGYLTCDNLTVRGVLRITWAVRAGQSATIGGLPVGARCTAVEDTMYVGDTDPAVLPGFGWAAPTWTVDGVPVTTPTFVVPPPTSPTQVALAATNTLLGRFAATKQVAGPGQYVGTRAFAVDYACAGRAFDDAGVPLGPGSGSGSLAVAAGETVVSPSFAVGSACTATEQTPTAQPGDFAPAGGAEWTDAAVTPSSFVIGAASAPIVAVTVTNTYATLSGSFTVTKTVEDPAGLGYTDRFTGTVTCIGAGPTRTFSWTLAAGTTSPRYSAPIGARCTVVEDAPPAPPSGAAWRTASITPRVFTLTDASTLVRVDIANVLAGDPKQDLAATGTALDARVLLAGAAALLVGGVLVAATTWRRRHRRG